MAQSLRQKVERLLIKFQILTERVIGNKQIFHATNLQQYNQYFKEEKTTRHHNSFRQTD